MYPNVHCCTITTARTWKQPRCPSADEWIRKLWYVYTMEYCSAIKKYVFESILMRWMNLEPVTQSEASHKEKDKYCILMHAYLWNLERWYWWTYLQGSNGDTDIENRLTDTSRGRKEKVGWTERVAWKHIHCCSKTDSQWEFTVWPRELQLRLCNNLEGWEGMEGRFQREGTYVYLWLIHGAIW